jgi:hypothetical protein
MSVIFMRERNTCGQLSKQYSVHPDADSPYLSEDRRYAVIPVKFVCDRCFDRADKGDMARGIIRRLSGAVAAS